MTSASHPPASTTSDTAATDTAASDTSDGRLDRQLGFLAEAERLRGVLRATPVGDGSRRENSGEHSWHVALHALALSDQAGPEVSVDRVIRMLLIHDLVEIDVGDVPIHSQDGKAHGSEETAAKERAAAERIFGLLPEDQGAPLLALWLEFEAAESPDAVFAKSLDRVQPVLLNLSSGGGSWIDYDVTLAQVESRVGAKVARGAPALWRRVRDMITPFFIRHDRMG